MNKMFTAVAILQLVEAGKVKLTAPLGKYLPDYPNREVATKVTIHQLLTHTGGTGDIFGPAFDAHRKALRSLDDYVKLYGKRGLEFKPGSRWAYSNYGFILLGVVIEKVSGQSYYDYVHAAHLRARGNDQDRIAARRPSRSRPVDRIHRSHPERPTGSRTPTRCPTAEPPPAAATRRSRTSPGSPHALLSHKLLSADATKLLITGKVNAAPPLGVRYAYGFEDARAADGSGWVGHGGGAPGMNGDLQDLPQVRLRGGGAGEHRPARSTAHLGLSRSPAPPSALAP